MAVVLIIIGGVLVFDALWLGLMLIGIGLFALIEALRGWCLARACGVKTRL